MTKKIIQDIQDKLSRGEAPEEKLILSALTALRHIHNGIIYLTSCNAATLESLPKSSSKSTRVRNELICEESVKMLDGTWSDKGRLPHLGKEPYAEKIQDIYGKLVRNEGSTENDVRWILDGLAYYLEVAGNLADLNKATLENLPKSTSLSSRVRHQSIYDKSIKILDGTWRETVFHYDEHHSRERCLKAIASSKSLRG